MKRALLLCGLIGYLSACSDVADYAGKRFPPSAHAVIKAPSKEVTAAIEKRLTTDGWKKTQAPASWTLSYSKDMHGFIPWLLYVRGRGPSSIRYDFAVPDSTGPATVDGRCMLLRSPDATAEVLGGGCLARLDQFLDDFRKQLAQGPSTK